LASEKLARNRIGLHHAGFETIWGIIEALYGKNIFEIAIWPPNCESWGSAHCPRGSIKPEGLGDGLKHNTSLPPAHLLLMNRMNQNLQASDTPTLLILCS
jgi:hypothetical protein